MLTKITGRIAGNDMTARIKDDTIQPKNSSSKIISARKLKSKINISAKKLTKSISGNRPVAGEKVLLVLVDNRESDIVNKAAYYVAKHARKNNIRLALIYVREVAEMQLFGISDIMREESKAESTTQINLLKQDITRWVGNKQNIMSYVREGDVSEAVCHFIDKNRFVSGLVITSWQLDNVASGLYHYISATHKAKDIRRVPIMIIPEDIALEQLDDLFHVKN